MRLALVALVTAGSFSLESTAAAEAGDPLFARVDTLMADAEYGEAREALEEIVEAGRLEPEGLAGAYRRLGECFAALRMPAEAEASFARVLLIDPSFYVSTDQSPLVREPYEAAARSVRDAPPVRLSWEPPERLGDGEPLVARPEVERGPLPDFAVEITLHLRGGGGAYVSFVGVDDVVEVGADDLEGLDEAAVYLALRDEHGNAVAMVGSAEEPLEIAVGGGDGGGGGGGGGGSGGGGGGLILGRPWYEQWWIWTAVGVVVVGLAVGLPLGLTLGGDEGACERELGGPCDMTVRIQ